jgi:hypothetical protein
MHFQMDYLAPLWQPSSDGFPEGLVAQPFYGWVDCRVYNQPVLTGFASLASFSMLKRLGQGR